MRASEQTHIQQKSRDIQAYINESIPSLPEIAVGDGTDSSTELCLNLWRAGDHQIDQFALDDDNVRLDQLVIAILISPVA